MKESKILNSENIGDVLEEQSVNSYLDFFKMNVLELLQAKLAEGENYKFTEEDIEEISDYLLNNDDLFDMLDNFIIDEMNKYKFYKEEN